MTDNMVTMWKDLMCALFNCIDEDYVRYVFAEDYCPINVESFVEHMLLEFCKYTYYKKSPKHSLRYYIPYDANVIYIGTNAFASESELATTIAHELNHARSFLKGKRAPEKPARKSEKSLKSYIGGKR